MSIREKVRSTLVWGFFLWMVGYIAGIVLFFLVPKNYIGWIIAPFATILTLWVLFKKIKRPALACYFGVGLVWMVLAVVLDYLFIVKMLKIGSSYYRPDVILYYALTFILPILAGYWKFRHKSGDLF